MAPQPISYTVTLNSDKGPRVIITTATTPAQARAQVCQAEGAPERAVIAVRETQPAPTIRTASDLKAAVEANGHEPHFFTRSTMRFFGDTMRNYGTRRTTVQDVRGQQRDVYELYRRRPVKHGLDSSSYFDASTFARVFADTKAHPKAD